MAGRVRKVVIARIAAAHLKFKLTIAYEGTRYAGWQTQKTGAGVQQIIERAAHKIFPNAGPLHGSSRTDAGVHAFGLVAHLEIPDGEFRMRLEKLPLALNYFLPEDIRIVKASRCPAAFHARFDARGKQYRYFVWNARALNPLLRRQAWLVTRPLDLAAMQRAARHVLGPHDFQSFAGRRLGENENPIRAVRRCQIKKRGPLIEFIIEADGFLYKMCRSIAGTLVQAGLGKFPPDEVAAMLRKKDRRVGGMTAPAHGLVLWKVFY